MPPKPQKSEFKDFSARLRAVIDVLDVEQKDLATTAEIQAPTVTAYLKAESQPSMLVLSKWAQQYRIDLNWLVLGEDTMLRGAQKEGDAPPAPSSPLGRELADIKASLQAVGANEDEIKQALLDYVSGGRSIRDRSTGTDDGSI